VLVPVSLASTGAVGCHVTQESVQNDSTDNQFRYVITHRANEKDDYQTVEMASEEFIETFVRRGVKPGSKDGSGIIGATFKPHSRLEQKNLEMVTALILDVDGKFKRDGQIVTEAVDPDWTISRLPFRGVAHTSFNHSPALPKYRLIFPLEKPITMKEHRRLWAWAFEQVQRKSDPACKNPDRMFYLPRASQEALDEGWPWVRELHGMPLTMARVPPDFVGPHDVPAVAAPRTRQGMRVASPGAQLACADGHKLLGRFMETPLVKWAKKNPSEVSREVWRGIATNLAAITLEQEDNEDLFEGCLTRFHEISELDGERYTASATTKCFHDAVKSAKHYGPMTFVHMAENGAPDTVCASDSKTPVAASRRLDHRERQPRHDDERTLEAAVGQAQEPQTSPPPTPRFPAADDDTEEEPTIFDFSPGHFLYDTENEIYLMKNGKGAWSVSMSNASLDRQLKSLGLQGKQLNTWKAEIRYFNGRKPFYGRPGVTCVYEDAVPYFNSYEPTDLGPSPGDWDNIRALLMNLVAHDPEAFEYLLDWLAAPLQSLTRDGKPMKMGTALVFRGAQGSGKGTFESIVRKLYGAKNVGTLGQDALDGRFNGELIDKLFVFANEVMSSSNRSMETANKLKMWVTDPLIPIEEKFKVTQLYPNTFNITFSSNDDRPVLIEPTDRRYSIFESKKLDETVARRIHADLGGAKQEVSAFYHALLNRKVKLQYGDLFDNDVRRAMIRSALPWQDQFASLVKSDGWHAVAEPWRAAGNPNNPRIATLDDDGVLAATIQDVFQDYCRRQGVRPTSPRKVIEALTREMPKKMEQKYKVIGGIKNRVWYGLPMHPPGDVAEPPVKTDTKPEELARTGTSDAPDFT
jgi:hypothetical protein